MSEITLAEVRNAYLYLVSMLAITYELTKANSNVETTIALLERLNFDAQVKRKYFSELYASVKRSLENLKNELLGIAGTFGETEYKIFIKVLMEKKDNLSIANELGLSEEYVRHLAASVKKKAAIMFNEHYESDVLSKMLNDIKEIQNGNKNNQKGN